MEHQFKDAEISAIVIVSNFAFHLEKVLTTTKIKHVIITQLGDMLGGLKGALVNFVVKNIKKMIPAYNIPQALTFKNAMKKGASLKLKPVEVDLKDIAVLQYIWGNHRDH